jgi:putative membrane protein
VEQNLADESVQKQLEEAIAPAKAGYDSLNSLKTQLDSVHTFVTGLSSYTDGVSQAAQGATTLHAGSTQLSDGAVQLSDGTAQLADGLDALKQTLNADVLPLLNGDVQKALDVFENTKNQLAAEVSFDLIDDGMAHDMVYIIRTDLNK